MPLLIRQARHTEHAKIMAIAKRSKYTKDFSNHIFSGEPLYTKGWIRVIERQGEIVGFTCFRHKVRVPETKLYFLGVDSEERGKGLGRRLMDDLLKQSPASLIALDCCKENPACAFYRSLGCVEDGEALGGAAIRFLYKINPA